MLYESGFLELTTGLVTVMVLGLTAPALGIDLSAAPLILSSVAAAHTQLNQSWAAAATSCKCALKLILSTQRAAPLMTLLLQPCPTREARRNWRWS